MEMLIKLNHQLKNYWYLLGASIIFALTAVGFMVGHHETIGVILAIVVGIVTIAAFVYLILILVSTIQIINHSDVENTAPTIIILIGGFLSFVGGIGSIVMIVGHVMLNTQIKKEPARQ